MKRRDFLQRFGIGVAAAVAAPSLVKAALPEDMSSTVTIGDAEPPDDAIIQEGEMTTNYDGDWISAYDEADFRMRMELDRQMFLGYADKPITEFIGILKP